jgi:beta-lactam-binding protein with PASTA domain
VLGDLAGGPSARGAGVDAAVDTELQTVALASERPTTQLPAPIATVTVTPTSKAGGQWARRRLLAAVVASATVVVGALVLAGEVRDPLLRVPNVVSLREGVARAQIERSLPATTVTVQRVYSTRVGAGRVIRQSPQARTSLGFGRQVQLVVSKGTPFAPVPTLAGGPAATARATLARQGFASRYSYAPSWVVRKGSVVGLQPQAGTRLRRPARITIVVASGYPRSVVPEVRNGDLSSAQQQLAANHLRYRLVWRLTDAARPGEVLDQIPAAGTSVYQGAQVRLTVARTLRWVKLFSASGSDDYESDVFTVPTAGGSATAWPQTTSGSRSPGSAGWAWTNSAATASSRTAQEHFVPTSAPTVRAGTGWRSARTRAPAGTSKSTRWNNAVLQQP